MAGKPWKDIQFRLEKGLGDYLTLRSNQFCGCILVFSHNGIHRSKGIGKDHGFDLDDHSRVKFFRGYVGDNQSAHLCVHHHKLSSETWNDTMFRLWMGEEDEQLVITSSGHNLLLIEKSGVYRWRYVSPGVGLPVDNLGRLRVLK